MKEVFTSHDGRFVQVEKLTPSMVPEFFSSIQWEIGVKGFSTPTLEPLKGWSERAARLLRFDRGDIRLMLWTEDCRTAAVSGAFDAFVGRPLPDELFDPPPAMFWAFEDVPSVVGLGELFGAADRECPLDLVAVLCHYAVVSMDEATIGDDGMRVLDPADLADLSAQRRLSIRFHLLLRAQLDPSKGPGKLSFLSLPTVRPGEPVSPAIAERFAWLFGMLAFLRTKVAAVDRTTGLTRQQLRAALRAGRKVRDVDVVRLRETERTGQSEVGAHSVDWHHRWIVSGHWRKRPPESESEVPVFVSSYVKGPSGKPLKAPRRHVYAVNR